MTAQYILRVVPHEDPDTSLLHVLNNQDSPVASTVRDLVKKRKFRKSALLVEALLSGLVSTNIEEVTDILQYYIDLHSPPQLRNNWRLLGLYFLRTPLLKKPTARLVRVVTELFALRTLPDPQSSYVHFYGRIPKKFYAAFLEGVEKTCRVDDHFLQAQKVAPAEIALKYFPDLTLVEYASRTGLHVYHFSPASLSKLLSESNSEYEYMAVLPDVFRALGDNPPLSTLIDVLKGLA